MAGQNAPYCSVRNLGRVSDRWINEGFLSREHEEMRKKAGEKALLQFYRREEGSRKVPGLLEKNFRWQLDDIKFIGRWDRIDYIEEGAVIIDFKATEVKDQKEADRKTRDSLQMDLYALSFARTQDVLLLETRLYFLESDIVGHAQKKDKELERAVEKIREVKVGILSQDYRAKPDWHNCSFCEFRQSVLILMPIKAKMGTVPFLRRDCPHFVELLEEYPFPAKFYALLTSIFFTDMVFSWSAARFFKPEENTLVQPQKCYLYPK
jgi:DNA helicase-2/ATP-dependent DNA helicase PcrA